MISIFKNNETGLALLTEPNPGCWINAINPTPQEIQWLQGLQLPPDYITYPLDIDLRVPYFQGQDADVPYTTIPLGIILNDRYIVTICKNDNEILADFTSGRLRGLSTTKRNRFVLRLLLNAASRYLVHLREINKVVDALEDQLQLSTRNKEVLELLKFQKS
ncbi:MAG: CorA family divalent cation transporter, partial [Anaerolineales bacterium]